MSGYATYVQLAALGYIRKSPLSRGRLAFDLTNSHISSVRNSAGTRVVRRRRPSPHAEHHMFMWVSSYKLPALHEKLREKGVSDRMEVAPGYIAVLREASGKTAPPTVASVS